MHATSNDALAAISHARYCMDSGLTSRFFSEASCAGAPSRSGLRETDDLAIFDEIKPVGQSSRSNEDSPKAKRSYATGLSANT